MQTLDAYDRVVEHGRGFFWEEAQGKWRIKPGRMTQVYRALLEGVMQEHLERGEESKDLSSPEAVSVLTIHKAKGLEFPVVAVVVDEENSAHATATHRLEHDVFPFRQDLPEQADLPPALLLGGDGGARALQDSVRHYKTGKQPQPGSPELRSYQRQMKLYAFLYRRCFKITPQETVVQ
ncbi:hypothetical protein KSC_100940 [Ktedonobacter sp. SOSP1-52]|nr:hypothetical protein KSC_100940 [Ktedonobacter sp. SOSP1-52]